ncbi:transcriptional regulator TbsP [Halobellus marinus]|uniref:transcriptional regulator TbsP n=1 Tax=Halobellus TaxID=1073986 RepID=UPI0028AF195A|nr:DUF5821 family protein [Halobellus sp. DFY28]
MPSETNVLGDGLDTVVDAALGSDADVVYVTGPTPALLESLVGLATDADGVPELRVLAPRKTLKTVTDEFLLASNAADLVEAGVLELRVTEDQTENALLVTEESVTAVVTLGDAAAGLVTTDAGFVRTANDACRSAFEAGERFTLRTPAISAVRSSLEADLGAEVRADFDAVLDSVQEALPADATLDEVTISLLVAAKNEVLLYDVSKWGEDVGIASKATFSRTKSELEEAGVIATEKVPIDVGRPRLRLKLDDERLQAASANTLADVARDILD